MKKIKNLWKTLDKTGGGGGGKKKKKRKNVVFGLVREKVKKKTNNSLFFLEIPKGFYFTEIQSESKTLTNKFIIE